MISDYNISTTPGDIYLMIYFFKTNSMATLVPENFTPTLFGLTEPVIGANRLTRCTESGTNLGLELRNITKTMYLYTNTKGILI